MVVTDSWEPNSESGLAGYRVYHGKSSRNNDQVKDIDNSIKTKVTLSQNSMYPSHDYPLIGWQTFTGAVPEFYSRFDLIMYRYKSLDRLEQLKKLNPNIVVVWTIDWNTANGMPNVPDDWILKDSKGNILHSYGNTRMMNLSIKAPVASSGPYSGKTYREYLPEYYSKTADIRYFDGWGNMGVWGGYGMSYKWKNPNHEFGKDVDIDNNGINDHDEYSTNEWVELWQSGVDKIMANVRAELDKAGSNKLLIINSGTQHPWGFAQSNGIVKEKLRGHFDDSFNKDYYSKFAKESVKPMTVVVDGFPHPRAIDLPSNTKNDFRGMRYGMVTSMFNDHYFSFQSIEAGEHYWSYWYDEFESNLGQPKGGPKEIREGLWVRFFTRGAAIANTNGIPQTVTDSDIRSISGYSGPYYRLKGGQDISFNNGQKFESVHLVGQRNKQGNATARLGDGLILFKNPTTIVSDIIIDNVDMGTSPGSEAAVLSNGFEQLGANGGCVVPGSGYYTLRCNWNPGTYAFAIALSGGSEKAVFKPTIGLPGKYEVFEWHPSLDAKNEGSNVIHEIKHANGTVSKVVNQKINSNRWNSLGVYSFNKSTNQYIAIKTSGTNGMVIADAIKFVYRSESQNNDTTPPNPPRNPKAQKGN